MADRIKGITIEIGGDTTKLQTALKQVNSATKTTASALRDVNKLLKFNPGNTELLKQKQKLLGDQIKNTKEKLEQLKRAQEQMDASGVDKTSEQYMALQREIIDTEGYLKNLEKEFKEFGSVGAQQVAVVGEKMKALGEKVSQAGKTLTQKVTAPIVGAFAVATKSALTFEDGMAKVYTIADATEKPMSDMSKEILNLSNQTGKSAAELAEATYQALSASVDTADAVDFVATAANLGKAGFLETADAVDVLTTVINAYGMSAEDAAKIADELVQVQNDGKTTVQELAGSMGTIIPTAAALNIPLEQLNAAYALMTKQGINTANTTTYLNGMFTELADGGSTVSQILQKKTGKTFGQLEADGQSLGDILGILEESVDGDSEAFLNLWGNTRAGRGALALVNAGTSEFNEEAGKMADATGNVSAALKTLQTPGAKARKALTQITNAGIQLGDVLAPYVEKAAEKISELTAKFQALSPQTKATIVKVLAIVAAVGPLLLILGKVISVIGILLTFAPAIAAAIAAINWPLVAVVAAVVAFIAIIKVLRKAWEEHGEAIKAKAQDIWQSVTKWFSQLGQNIRNIWNNIRAAIATAIDNAKTKVQNTVNNIRSAVSNAFNSIKATAQNVWNGIQDAITRPIETAKSKLQGIVDGIAGIFNGLRSMIKLPSVEMSTITIGGHELQYPRLVWNARAMKNAVMLDGATIFGAMNGNLYGGGEAGREIIVSYDKLAQMMGGGGTTNINVVVNASQGMNERQLADMVARRIQQSVNNRRAVWA